MFGNLYHKGWTNLLNSDNKYKRWFLSLMTLYLLHMLHIILDDAYEWQIGKEAVAICFRELTQNSSRRTKESYEKLYRGQQVIKPRIEPGTFEMRSFTVTFTWLKIDDQIKQTKLFCLSRVTLPVICPYSTAVTNLCGVPEKVSERDEVTGCTIRSFIINSYPQISLGRSSQGRWGGRGM
jgi:hypothetical protein